MLHFFELSTEVTLQSDVENRWYYFYEAMTTDERDPVVNTRAVRVTKRNNQGEPPKFPRPQGGTPNLGRAL